jgi:hypothetical protein
MGTNGKEVKTNPWKRTTKKILTQKQYITIQP